MNNETIAALEQTSKLADGESAFNAGLGAQVGIASWDVGHGQPEKPDMFECEEHYFHFPCGMCKYKSENYNLHCTGCRHYCP